MEIVRLERSRLDEASAVLARAFFDDPAWVWLLPDPERRARLLPWLFRIGFDITAAEVYATDGPVLGAARWLAPGRPPMRVGATLRALVTTPLRLGVDDTTVPRVRPRGRSAARGGNRRAALVPRRHRRRPGRPSPGDRRRAPRARHRRVRARRPAGRPAHEQRGEPLVLRSARLPHGAARAGRREDGPHAWAMVRRP